MEFAWPFRNTLDKVNAAADAAMRWNLRAEGAVVAVIVLGSAFLLWLLTRPTTTVSNSAKIGILGTILCVVLWYGNSLHTAQPVVVPVEPTKPKPHRRIFGDVSLDGNTHNGVEVVCDLPQSQRVKNATGTDGAGLCVWSSLTSAARWQNCRVLAYLQREMRKQKGGGWPSRVDSVLKKHGYTNYINYQGKDPTVLLRALATDRMPCVTYDGHDGVHYKGKIAHMVNLVYLDTGKNLACICDNNFIGDNELVWMTYKEFIDRWVGDTQGWAVILLNNPPPPMLR